MIAHWCTFVGNAGGDPSGPPPVELAGRDQTNAGEHQRNDRHDLEENVHRRAGGVLEGITHGVADDRSLVRVGTLAAVVAGLDVLLGVVPGTAGVRHEDRQRKARHERAGEQAAEGIDIDEADDERHDDRKGAGDDHLLERRIRADGHATGGVGHPSCLSAGRISRN